MDSRRNTLSRLLAGLQAGILGGLCIFAWFLFLSYASFRAPWGLFNIVSASLRSNPTWALPLSASTWTGIAAHLFACGTLGMIVGFVLPRPLSSMRISLAGFAFGVVISLLVYEFFWRRYVPLLSDWVRPIESLISHLLFGLSLSQFPRFYNDLIDPPAPLPAVDSE